MSRWILLLFAIPCFAQFRELRFEVQGTECLSCNASLPERLKRIRGVESVILEGNTVSMKFAPENRVRFEQIRDMIEQDGTKVKTALFVAKGKHDGDSFKVGTTEFALPAGVNLPADEIVLRAKVPDPHRKPIPIGEAKLE